MSNILTSFSFTLIILRRGAPSQGPASSPAAGLTRVRSSNDAKQSSSGGGSGSRPSTSTMMGQNVNNPNRQGRMLQAYGLPAGITQVRKRKGTDYFLCTMYGLCIAGRGGVTRLLMQLLSHSAGIAELTHSSW